MIQALIIDDDVLSTEGVRQAVPWEKLGVTAVYTANSMAQAQAVLQEHEADILFLDVEMPKGSGFDLLRWLSDTGRHPVVIMLTSYASFEYARTALNFQCLDYLLKPSSVEEMTAAAGRAAREVLRRRSLDTDRRLAMYWQENAEKRLSMFWRSIIAHPEHFMRNGTGELASELKIEFDDSCRCLPLLIHFFGDTGRTRFQGFREEFPAAASYEGDFLQNRISYVELESGVLLVRTAAEDFIAWREDLVRAADCYIRYVQHERGERTAAYAGEFGEAAGIGIQYEALAKLSGDNVSERTGVFLMEASPGETTFREPDIAKVMQYVLNGDAGRALELMNWYIEEGTLRHYWNRERLATLQQSFMRGYYAALSEREIAEDMAADDREVAELFPRASESIKGFRAWAGTLLQKTAAAVAGAADDRAVVRKAKQYIREHLSEDIGRDDVAAACALSPDYVSRIFHQESGMKMSDYLTGKRMERARQLLSETELSVGEVADRCGYGNLAYFSRVFRIRNGKTPAEYRNGARAVQDP